MVYMFYIHYQIIVAFYAFPIPTVLHIIKLSRLYEPLTRREVNQLHSLMAEPLNLLELLTTPQSNASLVECGQVGAFRRPAHVRFCPALKHTQVYMHLLTEKPHKLC